MKESKKKSKKKKKLKIKNPKKLLTFLLIIVFLIIIIVKKINTPIEPEKLSLYINNEDIINELKDQICVLKDVVYFSLDDIKKCLDNDLYQEENKIILSSSKKIAVIEIENPKMEINGSTVQLRGQAFKNDEGKIYLPISELKNVYDMDFSYNEYFKNITIDYYNTKLEKAYTTKKVAIKQEKNIFASTLEIVPKDEWVVYLSEENGWAKIRTQNGNIGYVKKRKLKDFTIERENLEQKEKNIENADFSQDISKKNIDKYENRKNVIEEILLNTVSKQKKSVKIIYNKDSKAEEFKRFKIESTAFLAECGITTVFEE